MSSNRLLLTYEGCNYLRLRLILSTLSGRPVRIIKIRSKDEDPGLKDFELSLLKLLDKVTNGTRMEINETGTELLFQPGLLYGGHIEHECSNTRSLGYYLEVLACFAPFCKKALNATLKGVTNDHVDPGVDSFKQSTLHVLEMFLGSDDGLELKVISRGCAPDGGGEVNFQCPVKIKLRPVKKLDMGKVKRIRGVAYACKVSPMTANRVIETAKGQLLKFIPDIYIYTDHCKGKQGGNSPGYGLSLVAETTTGCFYSINVACNEPGSEKGPSIPEDLGIEGAHLLLEEIYRGGCVDSTNQSLACLFMALGQNDVSKLVIGPLSPYTIEFLRHMKDFFRVMFKLDHFKTPGDEDGEGGARLGAGKVVLTCVGIGYTNLSKVTS